MLLNDLRVEIEKEEQEKLNSVFQNWPLFLALGPDAAQATERTSASYLYYIYNSVIFKSLCSNAELQSTKRPTDLRVYAVC